MSKLHSNVYPHVIGANSWRQYRKHLYIYISNDKVVDISVYQYEITYFRKQEVSHKHHVQSARGRALKLKWGLKNWILFFKRMDKKTRNFQHFWGLMKWKLEPNLRCRTEYFCRAIFSHRARSKHYFHMKWGVKKCKSWCNWDLKCGGKGVKRGSWPPGIPIANYRWAPPPPGLNVNFWNITWFW